MVENQYFPLTVCPSLLFISSLVSAGSSGIEPRGTEGQKQFFINLSLFIIMPILYFMPAWGGGGVGGGRTRTALGANGEK